MTVRKLGPGLAYWSAGDLEGVAVVPREGEHVDDWAPGARRLPGGMIAELAKQVRKVLR